MTKNCILCGAELPDEFLMECKNMPASAQDLLSSDDISTGKGINLKLYQCKCCGLVQFNCEPVSYYRDVIRAGGFTKTMLELRRTEYSKLIHKYDLKNKKVVEVGCGRGEFIKVLKEFPVEVFGTENKRELVEMAKKDNLNVQNIFAGSPEIKLNHAPFDAFLSFNFLEHQPKPNEMLQCIYNNLAENGYGLITVPSLEYIIEQNSYYELLRDHIAYYTKQTLCLLCEKNGFEVLETSRINRDTLEVIVKKRKKINVEGLKSNIDKLSEALINYVKSRSESGKKIAVWGASHQGFTTISTTNIQNYISYIIDSAPFKQGKYAPASHLKIVAPEYVYSEPVQCIIVIAPGYTEEIIKSIQQKFGMNIEISYLKSSQLEIYND